MSHNGSSETSSFADECWASWFCSAVGHEYFCEVSKDYIEDSFNLFGLKQYLPLHYSKALDTILDRTTPIEAENEEISRAAVLLYGLIHARYITTSHGLEAMHRKYVQREFGECPRTFCRGQPVLPMGFAEEPKHGVVKLFCPKCQDVYSCPVAQRHLDGAYFGPTFPNLFFMTYEELVPEPFSEIYIPRICGFKIHPSSNSIPKFSSHQYGSRAVRGFSGNNGNNGAPAAAGINTSRRQLIGNGTSTRASESESFSASKNNLKTIGLKRALPLEIDHTSSHQEHTSSHQEDEEEKLFRNQINANHKYSNNDTLVLQDKIHTTDDQQESYINDVSQRKNNNSSSRDYDVNPTKRLRSLNNGD